MIFDVSDELRANLLMLGYDRTTTDPAKGVERAQYRLPGSGNWPYSLSWTGLTIGMQEIHKPGKPQLFYMWTTKSALPETTITVDSPNAERVILAFMEEQVRRHHDTTECEDEAAR